MLIVKGICKTQLLSKVYIFLGFYYKSNPRAASAALTGRYVYRNAIYPKNKPQRGDMSIGKLLGESEV